MNKEQWMRTKFGRMIELNEIIYDFDDRGKGDEAAWVTSVILCGLGYNFEVWKAAGQKSPHIHMKNIRFLDLKEEQLKRYKMFFLLTHTPVDYLEYLDFGVCAKHRIAEELKPHYKYKTIKYCLEKFNSKNENIAEESLIELAKKQPTTIKKSIDPTAQKLKDKLPITLIAQHYGLNVKGKMAVCPFHADKDPSLSLSDDKGVFHCFGCNTSGDLITFVRKLEDLKNGESKTN